MFLLSNEKGHARHTNLFGRNIVAYIIMMTVTEYSFPKSQQIQVAIKCLSKERMQTQPMEFLKEAAIMHTIDSEHIVRLYGVVLDTTALMLVS